MDQFMIAAVVVVGVLLTGLVSICVWHRLWTRRQRRKESMEHSESSGEWANDISKPAGIVYPNDSLSIAKEAGP